MAQARTPRSQWVNAGLRALARGGPDAVRVESLAETLSVSKGGFYWSFKDRSALLDAMLDKWERIGVDEVIAGVEAEGGDARAKLRRLFGLASATGRGRVKIELAMRDWGRHDKAVAKRLRRVDNRRMNYLRSLFAGFCSEEDAVESRSMLVFSLYIGSHFIYADHGDRSRADVMGLVLSALLK